MSPTATNLAQVLRKNAHNPNLAWHFFKHIITNSPSPEAASLPSLKSLPISLYNSLIQSSIENNHLDLAELLFREMNRSKINPDVRTMSFVITMLCDSGRLEDAHKVLDNMPTTLYNSLIQSLIKNKRFDLVEILYKEMRLSKVEPDVFTMNLFMMALCDLGRMEDACKVFDYMPRKGCQPNEFSFGILIRGYCRSGLSLKGLEMMGLMERPNMVIYNTLVSGFCREGKVDEAERLVERMKGEGLFPNVVTFNARISGLCKAGRVLETYRIFRDMEEKGEELGLPKPNQITYNLMLDGFCSCGMVEEGRALVESMKKMGFFTKLESYNIWLGGLVKKGELLEARALLDEMVWEGIEPSIYSYNIVVDGLCKERMISNAKSVVGLMRNKGVLPDTITYTTLIHGYCTDGNINMAKKTVDEMVHDGCFPNTFTCNVLLQSLLKEGRTLEAEELLLKMEEGHGLDIVSCNIVIDGLCKNEKLDKAVEIVRGMWHHGSAALGELGNAFLGLVDDANDGPKCFPDLISYSTLINGLCKVGRIEEAKKQLLEMMAKNIAPDEVIYDTFIHGYCKQGKVSSAFKVVTDMEKKGFKPSTRTYNLLIWGMGKKVQINEIQDLIKEMQSKRVQPDVITYNNLICCLCEGGMVNKAASVLDEMVQCGIVPNMTSYRLLIKAFCKACLFDSAQITFQAAITTCGEKEILYRLMCNELCARGKVLEAKEIFQIAIDKGFTIENFTYQILIEELCRGGNVDDARNLVISMVNGGYQFDPAALMPLIDALTNLGEKHEANRLSEQMMDMSTHQNKSFDGVSHGHSNEVKNGSSKLIRDHSLGNDWHSILHRDDGSGIALKVLKRVQKGWGQGSIRAPRTKKINFLDDLRGAE